MSPILLAMLVGYLVGMLACFVGIAYVRSARGVREGVHAESPYRI